ncbi:MAG: HEAT repeat domain-containing protein, partial [Isosphaeraceae bacterium]
TILDAARYVGRISGLRGARRLEKEVAFRSPMLFRSNYFIEFIRGELRDPRALKIILEGLTDVNEDVRIEAIRLLENLGHIPEVLEGMAASLDDPDPGVRTLAVQTIAKHGGPKIFDLLRTVVRGDKPRARLEAVRTLGALENPAQPALEDALGSNDPAVRVEAALLLGERGHDAGKDLIVEALRSSDQSRDHHRAVRALGKVGGASEFPLLFDLIDDARGEDIKLAVVGAIHEIAGRMIAEPSGSEIVDLLRATVHSDKPRTRLEAVRTLGLLGPPAQAALEEALMNGDTEVQLEAALLLGEQGRDAGKDLIIGALRLSARSQDHLRAIRTLGKVGDASTYPLLLDQLDADREDIQCAAVEAIGSLNIATGPVDIVDRFAIRSRNKPAAKRLIDAVLSLASLHKVAIPADVAANLLKHSSWNVRQDCAKALGVAKAAESVPALIKTLGDSDYDVRREAARALGLIGDSRARPRLVKLADKERDDGVKAAAKEALIQLDATQGRIDLLSSHDPDARRRAAVELGEIHCQEAVPALIEATGDVNAEVRREAAMALGLIHDPVARACLERLAKGDPDQRVQRAALGAIKMIEEGQSS